MIQLRKHLRITAAVSDAYDGLVRLAVDAQRFGFIFNDVTATRDGPLTQIAMSVLVDPGSDCAQIAARLGRHPAVRSVQVHEVEANASRERPAPVPFHSENGAYA